MSRTLEELKRAGIINSKEEEDKFVELMKSEWGRRERARWYLEPNNPDACEAFFLDFVIPSAWRGSMGPIHKLGSEFITNAGFRNKMILWPREHIKTTKFTVGETARLAIGNADLRFLLTHHKHKKSMQFLGGIKGLLLKESVLKTFGARIPDRNDKYRKDNEEQLTLATRKDLTIREATFNTGGVDKVDQSGHFDYIVADDLITEENAGKDATPEQLEKPSEYYRTFPDLLDKVSGQLWVIGTRHHPIDTYGVILDEMCDPRCRDANNKPWANWEHVDGCNCEFDCSIWELRNEEGQYAYPARFNDKMAAALLRTKGVFGFAKHYLNNPTDPSTCWLKTGEVKASLVSRGTFNELRNQGKLLLIQICDPAESKKKRSAYTGVVTVGVHKDTGEWWIGGATAKRVETRAFVDLVFSEHQRFRPDIFAIELNTRKAMKYALEMGMAERNYYFSIDELQPKFSEAEEKRRRFKQNVVPIFQYGKVHVVDDLRDLIQFLETAPTARYWDLGDCLSYVPDLAPIINQISSGNIVLPEPYVHWEGVGY